MTLNSRPIVANAPYRANNPVKAAIAEGLMHKTLDKRIYELATGARISYDASMSTGYYGIAYVIPFGGGGKPGFRINVRFDGEGSHPLFHLAHIPAAPDDMEALWKAVWIYNTFMANPANIAIIEARGTKYTWTEADYGVVPPMPCELFDPASCKEQRLKVYAAYLQTQADKLAKTEAKVNGLLTELQESNATAMTKQKKEAAIYLLLDIIEQLRRSNRD